MKSKSNFKRRLFISIFLLITSAFVHGQQKRSLDHDVYDFWNRINENSISENGRWLTWYYGPEDKDATLQIKNLASEQTHTYARGELAAITNDSKFAAFLIKAHTDSVKKAKQDKKKPEEMPKDTLGITNLDSGEFIRIARVKSFKMPKEGSGWIAYHLEKSIAKKDTSKTEEKNKEKKAKKNDKKDSKKKKAEGTKLVLRNLATGAETRFSDVSTYLFSEDGNWLVYTAANKDSTADAIYVVEVNSGKATEILTGKGDYKQAVIDKAGKQVAFLSNRDDFQSKQPAYTLYYWRIGSGASKAIAAEGTAGLPNSWWVSEHGKVSFSENGKRILFGTAPRPEPEPEEEPEDKKVTVDIWNWKDPYLQPMQLKQVKQERERSYLAVVHLDNGRIVQLSTIDIPQVEVGNEGNANMAVGHSNLPYRQLISWDSPGYYDVYLIDATTGKSRLVVEKLQSRVQISPAARYLTWWNRADSSWYALDVKKKKPVNLTGQLPQNVYDEIHDRIFNPNPYGSAGWTDKDQLFLIYDKYDIWATDPTEKRQPWSITEGVGRRDNLRFRYVKLDPEDRAINPNTPMLLSAFHDYKKSSGFYRDKVSGTKSPSQLVMMDHRFSRPKKSKNANILSFTRSSFVEFPDLWTSEIDLSNMQKVSNVNPQQSEYLWGTAELTEWTSLDGIPLQGILYKPENFNAKKKYPMMVYFYERSSHNLHRHRTPGAGGSSINVTFYVSRGYVVFIPDIPYKVGYPGESAMNAVVPGVTHLIKLGFVDEKNIGVQGHSWGGYQIAYMVTRTSIFKAAEAGAPVANMISAYGGIRWGTGMSRMHQYERTQSRIGGSLWEYPMRYMENSPIFWADKIETPVLMLHNDKDTAVPWYQGIEFFVALRRLGKPVWLFNYNGEPHGLRKLQNKKDWAKRLQQFFDHYLQGAPEPVWMKKGVPAIQKGKTLGLETSTNGM